MGSLRPLLRQPVYTALSVITLTLAVGANLVVFTIVNAIWIRPRPVRDPGRIVMVMGDTSSTGSAEHMFFAELGLQWQVRDVPAFELVAGQVMTSGRNAALTARIAFDAVGHPVETIGVTSEYFGVLGLPIRGRDFRRDDDRYGATPVAIISDRLWKTAFGGRADILGATASGSPLPIQIIGIAPPGFSGARLGEQADLWIPRNLVPYVSSIPRAADGSAGITEGSAPMLAIARLRVGVTPAEAERLIEQYAKRLSTRLSVVRLSQTFGSPDHRTIIVRESGMLRVIGAAAALVLVGGCATLMALVFVHYERRRSEFGIRLALGASAPRLARRMAGELAWIVAAGSVCAGLAAAWGLTALPALELPGGISFARLDLGFDWRVVGAGIAAATVTMILASALPMRRFASKGIAAGLMSAASTASSSSLRLRQVILVAHVAATVAVVAAAGFFVQTIQYGFNQGPGFDAAHTAFIDVDAGTPFDHAAAQKTERVRPRTSEEARRQDDQLEARLEAERRPANQRLVDAIRNLPGVEAVVPGIAPLGLDSGEWLADPKSIEVDGKLHMLQAGFAVVSPRYLDVLGLRLVAGRALTAADARDPRMPQTVLVTASLAATLWPVQSPLGQHFLTGSGNNREVVGVVEDFAFGSMRFDPRYVMLSAVDEPGYISGRTLKLVVRTGDPDSLVGPLRHTIVEVMPNSPRFSVLTGRDLIAADMGRERLGAWFFSGFGLVATALAVGGVFGMVAYLAESRRREFGIRAALGASPSRLVRMAIAAGLIPVTAGTGLGLVAAVWLVKAAESFLMGVHWFNPTGYAIAGFMMIASAGLAGLAAAWRITRIAPGEALRDM